MPSRILAVYAHPDDESFSFAGTAMKLVAAGHQVGLLTLTRGDAGRWYGRRLGSWKKQELARERAKEWRGAVRTIGLQRAWLLRWPDGGVAKADPDKVTLSIVRVIRAFRPHVVITFGPEGASGHDDHVATSRYVARAFRWAADLDLKVGGRPHRAGRLYFAAVPEISRRLLLRRPEGWLSPTHVVDISRHLERKARVFENHRTQFKDRPFFHRLLRWSGGKEYFHLAIDRAGRPAKRPPL